MITSIALRTSSDGTLAGTVAAVRSTRSRRLSPSLPLFYGARMAPAQFARFNRVRADTLATNGIFNHYLLAAQSLPPGCAAPSSFLRDRELSDRRARHLDNGHGK